VKPLKFYVIYLLCLSYHSPFVSNLVRHKGSDFQNFRNTSPALSSATLCFLSSLRFFSVFRIFLGRHFPESFTLHQHRFYFFIFVAHQSHMSSHMSYMFSFLPYILFRKSRSSLLLTMWEEQKQRDKSVGSKCPPVQRRLRDIKLNNEIVNLNCIFWRASQD
jgi:hypothetical protein